MKFKDQEIFIGNCIDVIRQKIDTESIQTVITSPPYNINKKYGAYSDDIDFNDWKDLMHQTFKAVDLVLKKNGSFFLNVSPIPDKKTKEIIPLDAICYQIGKENKFPCRPI